MADRFSTLVLVPPKIQHAEVRAEVSIGTWQLSRDASINLPSRLFWCDPPWYRYENSLADKIAIAVANQGITVSAARWDLSTDSLPSAYHDGPGARSRMLPYRPERFGVSFDDFDQVSSIDLRLVPESDAAGVPVLDLGKVSHFGLGEAIGKEAAIPPLPSLTLPPDVEGMDQLRPKMNQLHALAPQAALFVSILPQRLSEDLPILLAQNPDGVILRCEAASMDALSVTKVLCQSLNLARQAGNNVSILLAPGKLTGNDAIKLLRVGASAIAIDHWCDELLEEIDQRLSDPSRSGTVTEQMIEQLAKEYLGDRIERFAASQTTQQVCNLTANDPAWIDALAQR